MYVALCTHFEFFNLESVIVLSTKVYSTVKTLHNTKLYGNTPKDTLYCTVPKVPVPYTPPPKSTVRPVSKQRRHFVP